MATENIGSKYNTQIPSLTENADIQTALKIYHYGQSTEPSTLVSNSIAGHLQNLEDTKVDIVPIPVNSGNNNLNLKIVSGYYSIPTNEIASAGTNFPPSATAGMLSVINDGSGLIYQTYLMTGGVNKFWWRGFYSGAWTTWAQASDTTHSHTEFTSLGGRIDAVLDGTSDFTGATNFTGSGANSPTAVTQSIDDSSTRIATTAFVTNQAAAATSPMDGTAAVGTSKRYARQDHVHPSDTTKLTASGGTASGITINGANTLSGTFDASGLTTTGITLPTSTTAFTANSLSITGTEIGYLDGLTSNVQNQITNGLATKPTQVVGYKDTGTTAIGGNAVKKVIIASPNVAGTAPNAAGYTAAEGDLWFW